MPLFKGKGCKSTPAKAIDYITNSEKAEIVSSQCMDDNRSYAQQFRETGEQFGKGKGFDERKYYHFKFSCDPADRVSPEQSHKMAEDMAAKSFSGHECVIATHTDKAHIHSHIIVNAINFENGKKLHLNNSKYGALKDRANEIAQKNGFTPLNWRKQCKDRVTTQEKQIILRGGTSWKDELKDVLIEAMQNSTSFIAFRNHLEKYGVAIERNTEKTISFKHPEKEKAIRGNRLGEAFAKGAIMNAISQQRNRGTSGTEELTTDCRREISQFGNAEPGRVGKHAAQGELDRIHGAIRNIEERAKQLSPTGSDADRAVNRSRNRADEQQRNIEQQHRPKYKGNDFGR